MKYEDGREFFQFQFNPVNSFVNSVNTLLTYVMASKKIKREQNIKQFIDLYKHHTLLWDVTNKDYTNKRKRVTILKQFLPLLGQNATIGSVRKKIDILRSSYFREWKKVQASKDTDPSDIYKPTLFYYNKLCFLTGEEPEEEEEAKPEINSFDEQVSDDKSHLFTLLTECKGDKASSAKKRKKRLSTRTQEEFVNNKKEKRSLETSEDDDKEQGDNTFGLYLNQQLQKLSTDQRTFAEKLMSDALFMARTNQLNGTSQIITPIETSYLSDNSASD